MNDRRGTESQCLPGTGAILPGPTLVVAHRSRPWGDMQTQVGIQCASRTVMWARCNGIVGHSLTHRTYHTLTDSNLALHPQDDHTMEVSTMSRMRRTGVAHAPHVCRMVVAHGSHMSG